MDSTGKKPSSILTPLVWAWLALATLTLISLGLGQWFRGAVWLQLLVAAIVWVKGLLVARHFIEVDLAHPFIRRVLLAFVAFTPLALVLVSFFGSHFARWATL